MVRTLVRRTILAASSLVMASGLIAGVASSASADVPPETCYPGWYTSGSYQTERLSGWYTTQSDIHGKPRQIQFRQTYGSSYKWVNQDCSEGPSRDYFPTANWYRIRYYPGHETDWSWEPKGAGHRLGSWYYQCAGWDPLFEWWDRWSC